MYEPVNFMNLFLAPYLEFDTIKDHVALHVPCTSKQAGLTDSFVRLAEKCSKQVSLTGVRCVGMRAYKRICLECKLLSCTELNLA